MTLRNKVDHRAALLAMLVAGCAGPQQPSTRGASSVQEPWRRASSTRPTPT